MKQPLSSKLSQLGLWLFFILATLVLARGWLAMSALNLKYDWGFSLFDWTNTWNGAVSAWNDLFLGEALSINAGWLPASLLASTGTLFKLAPQLLLPLLVMVLFVLAGVGMAQLLRGRQLGWGAALLGGLVYAFSPLLLIRSIIGFIFYLIAAALAPWFLRLWWEYTATGRRDRLYTAAVLLSLILAQPQFAFMIGLLLALDLLLAPDPPYRLRSVKGMGLLLFTQLLVHLPWLYLLFRHGGEQATATNTLGGSLAGIAALPHSLVRTLFGADHHITFALFDELLLSRFYFVAVLVIIGLALAAVIKGQRETRVVYCALALALPLALATQLPTGNLFTFVYQTVPGANLFREVYHWSWVITFSLAFLAASSVHQLLREAPRWRLLGIWIVGLVVTVGWLIPFRSPLLKQYISTYRQPAGYREVSATQPADEGRLTRSFFLPALGFIKYQADPNPGATNTDVLALSTNRSQLPYQSSLLDFPTPAQQLRNALLMAIHQSDPLAVGYLRQAAVTTVFVRPDLQSAYRDLFRIPVNQPAFKVWDKTNYEGLLTRLPGVNYHTKYEGVTEYTVTDSQPLLSLAANPVVSASDWQQIATENQDAVFYLEDLTTEQRTELAALPYRGEQLDLAAATVSEWNHLDRLAVNGVVDYTAGWVRPNAVWWYSPAFANTKDRFLFTASAQTIRAETAYAADTYTVVAKVWQSPVSQRATIAINDHSYELSTVADGAGWSWRVLGELPLDGRADITVAGAGDTGIAQLLIVPSASWQSAVEAATTKLATTKLAATGPANQWQPNETPDSLEITKESATRWQLTARTDQPRLLVWRAGFDPDWQLRLASGETLQPVPVNGYAMAWLLPAGESQGTLIFTPQRPYSILLSVAAVWLTGLWLVGTWRRE